MPMNKYMKIGTFIAILVVVAVVSDYLATQNAPSPPPSIFEPRPLPLKEPNGDEQIFFPGDIELYYKLQTSLSSINATLLVILLVTYVKMFTMIKSEFTLGLILFSITLLFYTLTSNPILQRIFGFQAFGLGPFAMLPNMFTTIALVVLFYLTTK
jgi:hypothetical protein